MRSSLVTIPVSAELAAKLERHPLPRLAFERAVDRAIADLASRQKHRDRIARLRQERLLGWRWS